MCTHTFLSLSHTHSHRYELVLAFWDPIAKNDPRCHSDVQEVITEQNGMLLFISRQHFEELLEKFEMTAMQTHHTYRTHCAVHTEHIIHNVCTVHTYVSTVNIIHIIEKENTVPQTVHIVDTVHTVQTVYTVRIAQRMHTYI